ncbi:uncharacterized protein LOC113215628 isoform X2 [Frankliniella occidentalis]|uniref:Uncharacterized protein LOC113215628 isoform X2 n=1 Tax=Frankliniella occidentalis TaxID=133901 RepID=A0A9C6X5Z1_FRAOC|nr:uncharacterized protein LOC113215628 isoform X2 [Frankliniella occidentalis]
MMTSPVCSPAPAGAAMAPGGSQGRDQSRDQGRGQEAPAPRRSARWRGLAVAALLLACCCLPAAEGRTDSVNSATTSASSCRDCDSSPHQLTSAISLELAPGESPSSSQKRRSEGQEDVVVGHVSPNRSSPHSHVVNVRLAGLARSLRSAEQPKLFGKNSFLTGFGLGFLAFGLKKLLLPFFIGAQIVKSILIAMFLPSILGSVGKLVGKGVTTFASSSAQNGGFSGSSGALGGGGGGGDNMEDFDFKDNGAAGQYPDAASSGSENMPSYATLAAPPSGFNALQTLQRPGSTDDGQPLGTLPAMFQAAASAASNVLANRYQPKTSYAHKHQYTSPSVLDGGGSFYNRHKPHDYKTFQNIPSSSMLLTHYDPFYSPLLSRLDSVFHQLGYSSEACRERLVCAMYRNPAKFAPFSNLVSAQLSRELNELRKPSSDNPEILRFFRYMKAAKDGQDNQDCTLVYAQCTQSDATQASPMAHTFQDINKLVQARRMSRMLATDQRKAPESPQRQSDVRKETASAPMHPAAPAA